MTIIQLFITAKAAEFHAKDAKKKLSIFNYPLSIDFSIK